MSLSVSELSDGVYSYIVINTRLYNCILDESTERCWLKYGENKSDVLDCSYYMV